MNFFQCPSNPWYFATRMVAKFYYFNFRLAYDSRVGKVYYWVGHDGPQRVVQVDDITTAQGTDKTEW